MKDYNIKLGNIDEDGKSINDVEKAMNNVNIAIRTSKGEFKEFDTVLQEFVTKYKSGTMSQVDFLAGVNTLGGTRQKETLLALVENFDQVKKHQQDLVDSTGSAKQMYDVYSQSLEARINDLKRSFEGLYEKIMSSDSLKWLVSEATNLITALSNLDGKSIAYIATIGTLSLALSKLVKINKELMLLTAEGGVVTGLSKFIGLASGMVALENGATGVATAFGVLGTSIKGATASALAFMATPIGLAITAITATIGIAVYGFVSYQQHQAELAEQSKSLKSALEGVNEALKGGDTTKAQEEADKMKKAQEKLQQYIELRKKAEDADSRSFNPSTGGVDKTSVIESYNRAIKEQIKVLKDAGYTVEETTGKIEEFADAQDKIDNTKVINSIKEQTKAQLENRQNMEQMQQEFNNYISAIQNLYSEYQNLSAQENLSAEQKTQLQGVVEQLQGKMSGLSVSIDENGKAYISNSPLIEANIQKLTTEGITVDNLSAIRITDAKINSEWQVGNSQVTYSEITNRIGMYRAEIQAIQSVIQARMAGAMDYSTMSIGKAQSLEENSPEFQQLKEQTEQLHAYEKAKKEADALYAGIGSVPYSSSGGAKIPSSSGGNYMPSGGGEKEKKVKDYTEDISKLKSELTIDELEPFNDAIKDIDNALTENKTLRGQLTEGSAEYQASQKAEIELYEKKKQAVIALSMAQQKQAESKKAELVQSEFEFDANGKIINQNEKLIELQNKVNNMGGSSEDDKQAKQDAINQLKDINDKVKEYGTLVEDTIPKTINDYNELANSAKSVAEAMKKANEEALSSFQEKLAGDILEDMKKEFEKVEEDTDKQEKRAKKAIEDEKSAKAKYWEDRIQALQDELDALNDETADNEKKLAKLKAERKLWLKDDSVFSKSKIADLDTKIAETEKTLKKDALSKQIDDLNKQKDADLESYDDKLKDQEEYYEKKKEKQKKKNEDALLEEKAYAKANKLITSNNQTEILKILQDHAQSYKDVGA